MEILIGAGANVNMAIPDGSTSLMAATLHGHKSVVGPLLGKGADLTIKNSDGVTAFIIAKKQGYDQIAELLRINLRSAYRDLTRDQVKTMLEHYKSFDLSKNRTGNFQQEKQFILFKYTHLIMIFG